VAPANWVSSNLKTNSDNSNCFKATLGGGGGGGWSSVTRKIVSEAGEGFGVKFGTKFSRGIGSNLKARRATLDAGSISLNNEARHVV